MEPCAQYVLQKGYALKARIMPKNKKLSRSEVFLCQTKCVGPIRPHQWPSDIPEQAQ